MLAATRRSALTNKRTNVECARGTTHTVAPWSWHSPRRPKRTVIINYVNRPEQKSAALLQKMAQLSSFKLKIIHPEALNTSFQFFYDWPWSVSHTIIKGRNSVSWFGNNWLLLQPRISTHCLRLPAVLCCVSLCLVRNAENVRHPNRSPPHCYRRERDLSSYNWWVYLTSFFPTVDTHDTISTKLHNWFINRV